MARLAREELAAVEAMAEQGDRQGARTLLSELSAEVQSVWSAEGELELADVLAEIGSMAAALKDAETSVAARKVALSFYERTLSPDHPELQWFRANLAKKFQALGDFHRARELQEQVLEVCLQTRPEGNRALTSSKISLAKTLSMLGEREAARALLTEVLERDATHFPADDRLLQRARLFLSEILLAEGELRAARDLQEKVLEFFSRDSSEGSLMLQMARNNLGGTCLKMGDLQRSRELFEAVVHDFSRTGDNLNLANAQSNLAMALTQLGDLYAARNLLEAAVAEGSSQLPEDHTSLHRWRINLAVVLKELGDTHAARDLEEQGLQVFSDQRDEHDPVLQIIRQNLAITLGDLGEHQLARELKEQVLAVLSNTTPPENPSIQYARVSLANTLSELGELDAARELLESALEDLERLLPPEHPDVHAARGNLAMKLVRLGDHEAARVLHRASLEGFSRCLPEDHHSVLRERHHLMWSLFRSGEWKPLSDETEALIQSINRSSRKAVLTSAPRQAEAAGLRVEYHTGLVLSITAMAPDTDPWPELRMAAFGLVESSRSLGALAARVHNLASADTLSSEQSEARLSGLAATAEIVRSAGGLTDPEELTNAWLKRDDAYRRMRESLPMRELLPEVNGESVAAALHNDEVVVTYRRYERIEFDRDGADVDETRTPSYLAFVLRSDGNLFRFDLGPARGIDDAVATWRSSVGRPLRGTETASPTSLADAGESLRALVFDPLRSALSEARRVYMVLDESLNLAPVDALPEGRGFVGDRFQVVILPSLAELLLPRHEHEGARELLAMGGIDYESDPEYAITENPLRKGAGLARQGIGDSSARPREGAYSGAPAALVRAGSPTRGYGPLPASVREVEEIAELFGLQYSEGSASRTLTGARASRGALFELAPSARYLHVATHGYFAPESVPSMADRVPADSHTGLGPRATLRERIVGLAPMVVCGLALAGANRPPDPLYGHVTGVVTAEELAMLNLAGCECAVLSACETSVGLHRAGQGVHSLQTALHAAGARSTLTSLWRVPDEQTRELMLAFYRGIWAEGLAKDRALWNAKMELRKDHPHPVSWAGWLLSGDPREVP